MSQKPPTNVTKGYNWKISYLPHFSVEVTQMCVLNCPVSQSGNCFGNTSFPVWVLYWLLSLPCLSSPLPNKLPWDQLPNKPLVLGSLSQSQTLGDPKQDTISSQVDLIFLGLSIKVHYLLCLWYLDLKCNHTKIIFREAEAFQRVYSLVPSL